MYLKIETVNAWLLGSARCRSLPIVLAALLAVASARPARADSRLEWQDDWRRVGATEYLTAGTMFASAFAITFWVPPAAEPAWTRPLWIDRDVRTWLKLGTASARATAAMLSDTLVAASVLQPLLVDGVVTAGLMDKNTDVMHELSIINLQAFALTQLLNASAKRVFARERPYMVGCREEPGYIGSCDSHDRLRSYYSGHSATAATGAGLVCAHHSHLPLYGSVVADGLACGGAWALAAAAGALRVAADRHWATDVLTGHIVGFTAGYLLPTLMYYGSFRRKSSTDQAQNQQAAWGPAARPTATWPPVVSFSGAF